MNHNEHPHHNENEGKSSGKAKADLNKIQDHLAEKTEHGHEAANRSQQDGSFQNEHDQRGTFQDGPQ